MIVKHKVAWQHEAILVGVNRTRVTYGGLTLPQWVQGFCKNILHESDNQKREKRLPTWQILWKIQLISHGKVQKEHTRFLFCNLEQGTLFWNDTESIDLIKRVYAPPPSSGNINKTWSKLPENNKKPWFCKLCSKSVMTSSWLVPDKDSVSLPCASSSTSVTEKSVCKKSGIHASNSIAKYTGDKYRYQQYSSRFMNDKKHKPRDIGSLLIQCG